ncbi:HAD-IA family hydrolase [Actinospica durhamensis]|uniref:HAD-IA family hydrolase n=1 Tax=Actinospica durhamensis TaxID=1508375 RepID=A0A941ELR5_9ACTN|nr:HAD-IA family hydrolase [Actinospica durhamensis]MBR7833987.1 HAD-IA family hydrolase [Actinospica durhamensis]
MTGTKIQAVLCDVDGVVRHWPSMAEIEAAHGLPTGVLSATAFAAERLIPAITGGTTDPQWRADVTAALARDHGISAAEGVVAAWSAVLPPVDAEVVALLRRTRERMPVALVSNATTRLEDDLRNQGIEDIADFVVNTSHLGFAKPDPRVFQAAARTVGVDPTHCLFVDDTPGHVAAARALGMPAIHFRTFTDLRDALQ